MINDQEILQQISKISDLKQLEDLKVKILGKNGLLTEALRQLQSLSIDEKKSHGAELNRRKEMILTALQQQKILLEDIVINQKLASENIDISQPPRQKETGKIHPITQATHELLEIFSWLGFKVADGPEIEDDYHNFTALNISENHPARQMHDTFYLKNNPNLVLRTHTSNVQIRKMTEGKPPFKFVAPGRVYRSDYDQTHTPMFNQIEGFYLDKNIHMGHLKYCLEQFLKAFFENDQVQIRLRPSYFPFTEPSAEVDIGYFVQNGELTIGKPEKWLEILGCGMIHKKVISNCGLDPEQYQGFAFGIGIDRLAMLKYGINDLRTMFDGDIRWLKHYGYDFSNIPSLMTFGLSR